MPEGLDPIEAGKQLHEQVEKQQESKSTAREDKKADHHTRLVQICEAVLLALVTVAVAWAGYSAARWNTESRLELAKSATLRDMASRDQLFAISLRNFDSSTFNDWFIAYTLHSPSSQRVAEHRFRPQFRVAFHAWLATNPFHNPNAPPGPTYMPEYKLRAQVRSIALDRAADAAYTTGTRNGLTSDNYVKITVFLAAVLFMVGIGSTFKLAGVRYALVTFGTALLILSLILILREPGLPG